VDTVGADTQLRSWKVLKEGGVLVGLVSAPSAKAASNYGVRGVLVRVRPNAVHLGRISQLIDGGTIRAHVAEVLPLAHARRAHEISQAGRVQGKLVLRV
jgi:NADPH:quinone reductase-like Zn-dependent oxidoreductase